MLRCTFWYVAIVVVTVALFNHLLVLSRRNPPFLFVNTNALASTVGRGLLVFSKKKKKMPTSTPPYTRKNSGMLLHPDCFYGPGDVGMLW
jgi:hypothetical protein